MRLLLVDSDVQMSEKIKKGLIRAHFAVDCIQTRGQLLDVPQHFTYDLVILGFGVHQGDREVMLQDFLRAYEYLPVIVLCSSHGLKDRIKWLDLGADDFMAKPAPVEELAARVRARLRRAPAFAQTENPGTSIGPVRLYPNSLTVTLDGLPVALTKREYRLLELLMRKSGQVLSRTEIEESLYAWGEEVGSNTIEVYVHQLRRKLRPGLINTIRGVGYQFAPHLAIN